MRMTAEHRARLNRYIDRVYSIGLAPYVESLKPYGLETMKHILDVGCGPGQWIFASAQLNPDAETVGVDSEEYFVEFARALAGKRHLKNCSFLKDSFENLHRLFPSRLFDLVLCNSVIQYIDEEKALKIFSSILSRNGILLMFWNHGPVYYLWRAIQGLLRLRPQDSLHPLQVLLPASLMKALHRTKSADHFVTYRGLSRLAAREGLLLQKIATQPSLDYSITPLGLPLVFSCRGLKTGKSISLCGDRS